MAQLSTKMGLQQSRITEMKSGKTKNPQILAFLELFENTDLSPEWLLLGNGNMIRGAKSKTEIEQLECNRCQEWEDKYTRLAKEFDDFRRSESQWKELLLRQSSVQKGEDQQPVGVGSDEDTKKPSRRRDEVP